MIVVNAVVQSTQEDIVATQGAFCAMESASRDEPGCLDYTFSVELNDSNVIRITEKWATLDDLKTHFETPHMAEFQQVMGERPPITMDVHFYDVTEIQPF